MYCRANEIQTYQTSIRAKKSHKATRPTNLNISLNRLPLTIYFEEKYLSLYQERIR